MRVYGMLSKQRLLDLVCVEESCGASYRQRYILTSFTMATALAHYSFLLFLVQAEKMSGMYLRCNFARNGIQQTLPTVKSRKPERKIDFGSRRDSKLCMYKTTLSPKFN